MFSNVRVPLRPFADEGSSERRSGRRVGGKVTIPFFGGQGINWEAVPSGKKRLVKYLWRGGWIGWWCQLILTAISTVTLTFASTVGGAVSAPVGSGLITSGAAVVAVITSWFWMYHLTRLGKKIAMGDAGDKVEGATQFGVRLNLIATALALLSAEQIVGTLVAAALTPGQSLSSMGVVDNRSTLTLQAFILQSNTNVLMASFIGLLVSWFANQVAARGSSSASATASS